MGIRNGYDGKRHQTLSTFSATLGSFGLGSVLGWTSPALPSLQETGDLGKLSKDEITWIASLAILGALLSGPIAGGLLNKIGRRGTMVAVAFPFAFGWILMASSFYLPVLMYCGRFLTGLCGGAFTVVIPVYVSEITEEQFRGQLGSLMVLMLVSGILFSYFIGAFVSWFWLSCICALCPVALFFAMLFMPESPKYLIIQKRIAVAEKSFRWLRGLHPNEPVGDDFIRMKYGIDVTEMSSRSWGNIFRPRIMKPTLICTCLMFFQQLGGINSVTMYTVDIFKSATDDVDPNMASIFIGIVQVMGVYLSMLLVDRLGRKFLLIFSSLVMFISMVILGAYFHIKNQNPDDVNGMGFISIGALVSFIIAYSFGMGPIPWLLVSELLSSDFKGEISAMITFTYWALAFGATKTFQDMINILGESGCYLIFGVVCLCSAIFTLLFVPETKGKTSADIEKYFREYKTNENLSDGSHIISSSDTSMQTEKS